MVYYTRFNNIYVKIITDEYLLVWLKGYKNMYSYMLSFESTCMDGEMIILSEVRYTEKDKYQISLKCEI